MSKFPAQSDHRIAYSVHKLYVNGSRMVDDYTPVDAVRDYLKLHPDADQQAVRTELDAELAKRCS